MMLNNYFSSRTLACFFFQTTNNQEAKAKANSELLPNLFEPGVQFHTMPYANDYGEAQNLAAVAHDCHFGKANQSRLVQDNRVINTTLPKSREKGLRKKGMRELTYTMTFQVPVTLYGSELTHTSLTFTVWIPDGDCPFGYNPPVPCTEPDCPVNIGPVKRFHYKGLYLVDGDPYTTSKTFGHSIPPYKVDIAGLRLEGGNPQEGDQELVNAFNKYHHC